MWVNAGGGRAELCVLNARPFSGAYACARIKRFFYHNNARLTCEEHIT